MSIKKHKEDIIARGLLRLYTVLAIGIGISQFIYSEFEDISYSLIFTLIAFISLIMGTIFLITGLIFIFFVSKWVIKGFSPRSSQLPIGETIPDELMKGRS